MNTKHCSQCDVIIQIVNSVPRVKEDGEDLCDRCYHRKLTLDMFLYEHEELLEDLMRGSD